MPSALGSRTQRSWSCRCGTRDRRQPGRDLADDRDAVLGEVEDRADRRCRGRARRDRPGRAARTARGRRAPRARPRPTASVVTLVEPRLVIRCASWRIVSPSPLSMPKSFGQLADRDEDREPEHEAGHHRTRQELRDEAEPSEAGDHEEDPGQDDHPGRRARRTSTGSARTSSVTAANTSTADADVPATTSWRLVPKIAYSAERREQACRARPAARARRGPRTRSSRGSGGPRS